MNLVLLAFNGVGGEERQVPRLDRVVAGELGRPTLRLRLTGQRRVVHLASQHTHLYTHSDSPVSDELSTWRHSIHTCTLTPTHLSATSCPPGATAYTPVHSLITADSAFLQSDHSCKWRNISVFRIFLGAYAAVTPGRRFKLLGQTPLGHNTLFCCHT